MRDFFYIQGFVDFFFNNNNNNDNDDDDNDDMKIPIQY